MNKTLINSIVERNLLNEKLVTDNGVVKVYTRNPRCDAIVKTYLCNICKRDGIEGQSSLFLHNKSEKHTTNLFNLRHQPKRQSTNRIDDCYRYGRDKRSSSGSRCTERCRRRSRTPSSQQRLESVLPRTSTMTISNACRPQQSPLNAEQSQTVPASKSILKSDSNAAMKQLSSSNSVMHQFYDEIELNSIAMASRRILDYSPSINNSENVQYPDYIKVDILLVTSQVRRMLEFKSIATSSMSNAQLERMMNNYMIEMSSKIGTEKSPVISDEINQMPSIGTSSAKNNVDQMELLNDIGETKRVDHAPTLAPLQPNQKNMDVDTINEEANENGHRDVGDFDDDIQYIGTFPYDGY